MNRKFLSFIFSLFGVFLFGVSVHAQIDASTSNGRGRPEEPLPKNVQENLKKMEVDRLKKEYDAMLERGAEAVKLTEEVETSFDKNSKLSSTDLSKLEKIEKLLKKIRSELGGDDDDLKADKALSKTETVKNAISSLKESAVNLFGELKKTSRFSISVVAIQSSNSILKIVRFLRLRSK